VVIDFMTLRTILLITLFVAWPMMMRAQMVVTSWSPIFKGIDHAIGTNFPDGTIPRLQVVNCVRVDLTDPDVELFTTPRATNYIADNTETYTTTVSNFLKRHNLKVAINANFYWSYCCGGSNPTAEGVASAVFGYFVSTGQVVSLPDGTPPNDVNKRGASLLFTTNKVPSFIFDNYTAGPYTNGTYTAVTGYYPVLSAGENIGDLAAINFPDPSFHDAQPRTAFGVSEDRRYLFLMTIDGRQQQSQGAIDTEIAMWFLQFGAWDGIVMDGGGSTSMYRADCAGNPLALNRSSYPPTVNPRRERYIGAHFGVRAKTLESFISDLSAAGGTTTATVSWTTPEDATSQVEYGLTPSYGTLSPLDSTLVTNHTVGLSGLTPGRVYYYRVLSVVGGTPYSSPCPNTFQTTNFGGGLLFGMTTTWKYQTNNLDGVNWHAVGFNDVSWPSGPGPMWSDSRFFQDRGIPNLQSEASGTKIPLDPSTSFPYVTHYFRKSFVYTNTLSGLTLTFSNYVDDGAVFYLNGQEIFRTNMPPGQIFNSTLANSSPCPNATCPMVFTLTGAELSGLVAGTNVLAVELHNVQINSADTTFEGALMYTLPPPPPPFIANVNVLPGETDATITWTTRSNSTSQILYGPTPTFGSSTPLDTNRVSNHAMVLTGLQPLAQYYFRLVSSNGASQEVYDGTFTTVPLVVPLVTFSNAWKFASYNLDGVNWTARDYDGSAWEGEGPALLYIENNSDVIPRNTPLPSASGGLPFSTYYFRTHFNLVNPPAGYALVFSNFIDDGAVFYLNGIEVARVRMDPAPAPVGYSSLATACPPNGCDATFETPDMFRIGGDAMTNLVVGDNVLAAEVHQQSSASSDIVFGAAVFLVRATAGETKLRISLTNSAPCVSWDGEFLTLQQASVFGGSNVWSDVPGPIRSSPYCISNPVSTTFYRLRN
jgi:exopolysaccharide biosynthesis protein